MRLALLSDIHGNPLALEAVLADIQAQGGVDAYWILGDFVALGYDPVGVLERVTALPSARYLRGNTDREVVSDERRSMLLKDIDAEPGMAETVLEVEGSFAWTQGYVTAGGWFDWLAALPLTLTMTLPDGTRLLGVHAAPGTDEGPGIHLKLTDDKLYELVKTSEADLICVGHTHIPLDRTVNGIRVVNLGSVSNPVMPSLQASYVLLEADASGYQLHHHEVAYDRQAVIEAIRAVHHPASSHIIPYIEGRRISPLVSKTWFDSLFKPR
jgi:predicted phosphodiesterase